jgi:hypothetical protein
MEDLKADKGDTFTVIAYHIRDGFVDSANSGDARFQYYHRPEYYGIPLSIINGTYHRFDAPTEGSLYSEFLDFYNQAAAVSPGVDISISLQSQREVRVEVTDISGSAMQGTLHIALVERHRPFDWRDMKVVDFVCRAMLPSPSGQPATIVPLQTFTSTQRFTLEPDWDYCSIVAFFQTADQAIQQAAVFDIPETFPQFQVDGMPHTGDLLVKGSPKVITLSSTRAVPYGFEFSSDGGATWTEIALQRLSGNNYNWTVPPISASRCFMRFRETFGGTMITSGLFAVGIRGDLNQDGKVDGVDRAVLIDYVLENRAALLPGADLNGDGVVDLFDLIYFDTELTP